MREKFIADQMVELKNLGINLFVEPFSFLYFNPSTELSAPLGIGKTKCESFVEIFEM